MQRTKSQCWFLTWTIELNHHNPYFPPPMDEASDAPSPWDFQPVYEFLRAFRPPDTSPSPPTPIAHSVPDSKPYVPKSLGDFSRIFETLSRPDDIPPKLQNESADSYSPPSSCSSEATPPSSTPDTEHFDDYMSKTAKGVQWKDEVNGGDLTESRRRSTRSTATIDPSVIVQLFNGRSELPAPLIPASVTTSAKSQRHRCPPSPIPFISVDRTVIQPLYTLTASEQKAKLVKKLLRKFGPEPGSLLKSDPALALLTSGNTSLDGIHVFVDCSNIIIGFYNRIKASRGLHEKAHIKTPPISYHSLVLILERGRPVCTLRFSAVCSSNAEIPLAKLNALSGICHGIELSNAQLLLRHLNFFFRALLEVFEVCLSQFSPEHSSSNARAQFLWIIQSSLSNLSWNIRSLFS